MKLTVAGRDGGGKAQGIEYWFNDCESGQDRSPFGRCHLVFLAMVPPDMLWPVVLGIAAITVVMCLKSIGSEIEREHARHQLKVEAATLLIGYRQRVRDRLEEARQRAREAAELKAKVVSGRAATDSADDTEGSDDSAGSDADVVAGVIEQGDPTDRRAAA
jgi:hypothetical protein